MGNSVISSYNLEKDKFFHSGDLRWKVYDGKSQKNGKISVWVFEKKEIEKMKKEQRHEIYEILKFEVANLTKLKHPKVLAVVDNILEDGKFFAFTTPRVNFNLFTILKNEMISEISELEIKKGLYDVIEGLSFLHNSALIFHGNVSPSSIFINFRSPWQLGGLGHSKNLKDLEKGLNFEVVTSPAVISPHPYCKYVAPEIYKQRRAFLTSDIYSFFVVCVEALSKRLLYFENFLEPKVLIDRVRTLNIEINFDDLACEVFAAEPQKRPSALAVQNSPFFSDDPLVKCLNFLDFLAEKDQNTIEKFLTGFFDLLKKNQKLTHKGLVNNKIVTTLLTILNMQLNCRDLCLEMILTLLSRVEIDRKLFEEEWFFQIRPLFSANEISVESVVLLINHLEGVFLKFCKTEEKKDVLLPFLLRCLEVGVDEILNASLAAFPAFQKVFDAKTLDGLVMPKILFLAKQHNILETNKQKLIKCVSELVEVCTVNTLTDLLIPEMMAIYENLPASPFYDEILKLFLKIFEKSSEKLNTKNLCLFVLPNLCKFFYNEKINAKNYETAKRLFDKISAKIHEENLKRFEAQTKNEFDVVSALGWNKAPLALQQHANEVEMHFLDDVQLVAKSDASKKSVDLNEIFGFNENSRETNTQVGSDMKYSRDCIGSEKDDPREKKNEETDFWKSEYRPVKAPWV